MRKIWLLAVAAALLATACRIETNILIDLNANGSGSFSFEIGIDDEFRQLLDQQGESVGFDDFSTGFAGLPGATASERQEGDMMFSIVTVDFADAAGFQEVIAAGGEEGAEFDVIWTEDEVTITATVEATGGLGDLGGAADDQGGVGDFDLGGGLEGFAGDFFSGSVIVSMPGEVSSHNADRVLSNGRLQWDLTLDGSDVEIMAVSSLGTVVPNVIGMDDITAASEIVAAAGLQLARSATDIPIDPGAEAEPGTIVAQDPPAGDRVAEGSIVLVSVHEERGGSGFPGWALLLLALAALAIILWLFSARRRTRGSRGLVDTGNPTGERQQTGE